MDVIRNTDAPLMRYSKIYLTSFAAAIIPTIALAEFLPGFSTLARHKGTMATNFHSPKMFWDGLK